MNQQQLLVLYLPLLTPLATLAIVMVGFLYNNSRLSDVGTRMSDLRSEMRTSIGDLRTETRTSIGDLRTEMRSSMGDMRNSVGDMRDMLRAEIKVLQVTMEKNHSEVLARKRPVITLEPLQSAPAAYPQSAPEQSM